LKGRPKEPRSFCHRQDARAETRLGYEALVLIDADDHVTLGQSERMPALSSTGVEDVSPVSNPAERCGAERLGELCAGGRTPRRR
jgi:hypothetical protein